MIIEAQRVVTIHYTLRNDEGEVLDSSEGRDPLAFIQGIGNLIPGLEKELQGKKEGDKLKAVIAPEHAYGAFEEELVHIVPLSGFKSDGDESLEVGMQVQLETENGISIATVIDIEGEDVTLDLNHPLAGETLHFDVEVVGVRPATRDELDHGHAHGIGGHHH